MRKISVLVAASLGASGLVATSSAVVASVQETRGQDCVRQVMATLRSSEATSISNADPSGRYQVGTAQGADGRDRSVLWRDGVPAELKLPPGNSLGDVNESGEIIGNQLVEDSWRGWRLRDGERSMLPAPTSAKEVSAAQINASGEIVGLASYAAGGWDRRGVVWSADNAIRVLARPDGFNETRVSGIDDDGTVVGTVLDWDYDGALARAQRALAWFPDGSWKFLPTVRPDRFSEGGPIRHGIAVGVDDGNSVAWAVHSDEQASLVEGAGPLTDINANGSVLRGGTLQLQLIQPGSGTRRLPTSEPGATGGWAVAVTDTEQVYGTDIASDKAVRWDCKSSK